MLAYAMDEGTRHPPAEANKSASSSAASSPTVVKRKYNMLHSDGSEEEEEEEHRRSRRVSTESIKHTPRRRLTEEEVHRPLATLHEQPAVYTTRFDVEEASLVNATKRATLGSPPGSPVHAGRKRQSVDDQSMTEDERGVFTTEAYRQAKRKMTRSPMRGTSTSPEPADASTPSRPSYDLFNISAYRRPTLSPTRRHALPFVEKQIRAFLERLHEKEKRMREAFPIINRKEALQSSAAYVPAEKLFAPGQDTYSLNRVRPYLLDYKQEAINGCSILMTKLHPLPENPRPLLECFLTDLLPPLCQSVLRLPEFNAPEPIKADMLKNVADIYTQVLHWLGALLPPQEQQQSTEWRTKLLFLCHLPQSATVFEGIRQRLQPSASETQRVQEAYRELASLPSDHLPHEWKIMNGGIIR